MKHQHVNPEEAVKIHQDIQSKFSLAIHWGTFSKSNEVRSIDLRFKTKNLGMLIN